MEDYINFFLYFITMCAGNSLLANRDSFISVHIRDHVRLIFGIFAFRWPRISVMTIISQTYALVMLLLFLLSKFISFKFLYAIVADPNELYKILITINLAMLIPTSIEVELCEWIKNRQR